jgi:hypothetical protein
MFGCAIGDVIAHGLGMARIDGLGVVCFDFLQQGWLG